MAGKGHSRGVVVTVLHGRFRVGVEEGGEEAHLAGVKRPGYQSRPHIFLPALVRMDPS